MKTFLQFIPIGFCAGLIGLMSVVPVHGEPMEGAVQDQTQDPEPEPPVIDDSAQSGPEADGKDIDMDFAAPPSGVDLGGANAQSGPEDEGDDIDWDYAPPSSEGSTTSRD